MSPLALYLDVNAMTYSIWLLRLALPLTSSRLRLRPSARRSSASERGSYCHGTRPDPR